MLRLREIERPAPKDNEVLVKIIATSVFAGDCELRQFDFPISFWLPLRFMFGLLRPRIAVMGQELTGSRKVIVAVAPYRADDLERLRKLIEQGKVKAVIDRSYPLELIAEAHAYVESGKKTGSVAITVAQNNPAHG